MLKLVWLAYWRAALSVIMTITSSTLGFAGMGLMFLSPYQSVMSAVYGGALIGASVVCAYVVARCLKEDE